MPHSPLCSFVSISLPITSAVHLCALACASTCKHVSGLPRGGLVFSAHPRVLHSYPRPLYLSTFSHHFVVYIWKVIGGLLNSLLVRLSCLGGVWVCGEAGRRTLKPKDS